MMIPSSPAVSPQSGDTGGSPPPPELPVRGVPDGCGLDVSLQTTPISSTPDKASVAPQIPIPSPHELLNLKKGWLMKQSPTKDWHKHWFVLQGTALMYFRDPSAENNGLMDGIIDMGLVQKVRDKASRHLLSRRVTQRSKKLEEGEETFHARVCCYDLRCGYRYRSTS